MENKYFSSRHNNCWPVVIDVHGNNSVILYILNFLSSSAEQLFDFLSRHWFVTSNEALFLMMHLNLMLHSGCKDTGIWYLWYLPIYLCVWLSKEWRFPTVSKHKWLDTPFLLLFLSKRDLYYTAFNALFWSQFRSFCLYLCETFLKWAFLDIQSENIKSRTKVVK